MYYINDTGSFHLFGCKNSIRVSREFLASIFLSLSELCESILFGTSRKWIRLGVLFLFFSVSGVCCSFSKNNFSRSIKLWIVAGMISLISYLITRFTLIDIFVSFGVIHFYAAAILIGFLLNKIQNHITNFLIIIILIILSSIFWVYHPNLPSTNLLLPLGIPSRDYSYGFDYFPIFPYLSFFLIGFLCGKYFYVQKITRLKTANGIFFAPIRFVGRHGLIIYITHMPIIFTIIYIIGLC